MNGLEMLTKFLGITLIVLTNLLATEFRGDNIIINLLLWLPFWMVVWTFLDWKSWTSHKRRKAQ